MYEAAAAWLMTSLNAHALEVSLVQVANNLPMFVLAMPAGALADIVDKRRFLILAEVSIAIFSTLFAIMVWRGIVTPVTLLLFVFLIGVGGALTAPAWQSIVPQLVPERELAAAIAANSVGINISRAIGPALGGVITLLFGIIAPFALNAGSNLGVIGALMWWRGAQKPARRLPAERFVSAIRTGFRYSRHNAYLRATLLRAVGFFLFASCYWALLPLIVRNQLAGGPELYGIILGTIGVGAVLGAFAMPRLTAKLGANRVEVFGCIGTAIALGLFGIAKTTAVASVASVVAGASWIAALSTLNISAQVALPAWVRGRGLAMYVAVFFGTMTLGSALWGQVASIVGLPAAHAIAAVGALIAVPFTYRWKLLSGAGVDLTPSLSWPAPIVTKEIEADDGPVLVTVEYRLASKQHRRQLLVELERLRHERLRDGAYAWGLFEDTAQAGRFLETFLVDSWLEHLRQHDRVTNADRMLQERVHQLLAESPKVTHLINAEPDGKSSVSGPCSDC